MNSKLNFKNESTDTIMIVDDEQFILKSLKRLLADEPYQVYLFDNVPDALDSLKERNYNIIISDYTMPYMSGSEFFQEVEKKSSKSIRILLTGEPTTAKIPEQISKKILHCQYFISKPWEDEELLQLIKDCLNPQTTDQRP